MNDFRDQANTMYDSSKALFCLIAIYEVWLCYRKASFDACRSRCIKTNCVKAACAFSSQHTEAIVLVHYCHFPELSAFPLSSVH